MAPVCMEIAGYREVRRESNEQEEIGQELAEEAKLSALRERSDREQ